MNKKSSFWFYCIINACLLVVVFHGFKSSDYITVLLLVPVGVYLTYVADKLGLYHN
jgi:hypothetical protein